MTAPIRVLDASLEYYLPTHDASSLKELAVKFGRRRRGDAPCLEPWMASAWRSNRVKSSR